MSVQRFAGPGYIESYSSCCALGSAFPFQLLPVDWRGRYGLHSLERLVLTVNNRTVHAQGEIPRDLGWFWQNT